MPHSTVCPIGTLSFRGLVSERKIVLRVAQVLEGETELRLRLSSGDWAQTFDVEDGMSFDIFLKDKALTFVPDTEVATSVSSPGSTQAGIIACLCVSFIESQNDWCVSLADNEDPDSYQCALFIAQAPLGDKEFTMEFKPEGLLSRPMLRKWAQFKPAKNVVLSAKK